MARYGEISEIWHGKIIWRVMARHGEIWRDQRDMTRYGEIWRDRYGEIWRDKVIYGEIWRDMARYGEIWRDTGYGEI